MKTGRRFIAIASALTITVLMAVSWAATCAEAADAFLWPLQEGKWMEFLVQSPDQSPAWKAQIKVTGAKTVGGTQYFSVEVPVWGQGMQETVFLRSSEKGVYRLEPGGECPVAELDPSGERYRCRTGAGGWEVTTPLAQLALKVPAGTFTTARLFRKHMEYDNGSKSPDWEIYIVPGLGPVKQVEYDGNFNEGQPAPGVARMIELVRTGISPEVGAGATQRVPARPDAEAESSPRAGGSTRGVATLGTVVEMRESSFILRQESLEVVPARESVVPFGKHKLAIGDVDNHLEVFIDHWTQIIIKSKPASLSALTPEAHVLAAGVADGKRLKAVVVSDLSSLGPPPEEVTKSIIQTKDFAVPVPSPPAAIQEEPAPGALSMCLGQDMDYNDPHILEFQGCYGGPSASGTIPTFDYPLHCVALVGCWVLHNITYTVALGGWGFDFPYRFSVSSNGLTYHVPSSVSLKTEPLKATGEEFTFWGGLGFNLNLDIDFEPFFGGSYDFTHIDLAEFSSIHQATGPAPMPGQRLEIQETVCPGVGVKIPDTPIEFLTLEGCEDLALHGAPFSARITATGKKDLATATFDFDGSSKALSLTPDNHFVDVKIDDFWWVPDIDIGFYLRLVFVGQFPFYSTPTTHIYRGPFLAITTPFPYTHSAMSLATDPLSLESLPQPAEDRMRFPVDPAPTHLTMIPANVLLEGEPIQACLQEDHLNVPVAGQTVDFTTGMPGGQPGITVSATTGPDGIARAIFPAGEHMALHAVWYGNSDYRASASSGLNVTIQASPDLKGEWIALDRKCTYRNKRPNCRISGKLKIENIGSLKAPNSVVRFYLSDDKVYDQGDTLLKKMAVGSLRAGKSSTKTLNNTIPSGGTAGGKYLIAVIDADNAVVEYKGDNHVVFGPFEAVVF